MKEKKNQKLNMIDLDLFQWFIVVIICMLRQFKFLFYFKVTKYFVLFYRVGSQFFITLGEDTTCSLDEHIVFGEVAEGHDILLKLNETICDVTHRPYQDIRFE